MKISESTIAEIVKRGDSATVYEIFRKLVATLNERNNEFSGLRQNYEKLKKLFTTTEHDKDRFRIVAKELTDLSERNGLAQSAAEISARHPCSDQPEGEISIELE